MTTILALDAAWTVTEPSGVALVQDTSIGWRCVAIAPSYDDFFSQGDGKQTDWSSTTFSGTAPDVRCLLDTAQCLAREQVDLVTLDMPVATLAFSSRRMADDAISTEFGSRWCSAHTPSATRPGPLGVLLSSTFGSSGYELATTATPAAETKRLVEVYPHPALLSLLRRNLRIPYKVGKSKKYWPALNLKERIAALLGEFGSVYRAIEQVFGALGFELPAANAVSTLNRLKRYEDVLDALVCAWVGVEYLRSRTVPLGNATAAIWCPSDVVHTLHSVLPGP
jgi:predicted RNase H-like nuclease